MRSTETSGVEANGFARQFEGLNKSKFGVDLALALNRLIEQISPVTMAVALTAFVSAGAFVVFDAFRTLEETTGRLNLIAKSFAAELSALDPNAMPAALAEATTFYGPEVQILLNAPQNNAAAQQSPGTGVAMLVSAPNLGDRHGVGRTIGGDRGTLSVSIDRAAALNGVWQRGIAAFGLAFLVSGIAFRRKEAEPAPLQGKGQRDHFEDLIATIPFGVACWSAEGELVVCNEHYDSTLSYDGKPLPLGITYHAAVRALVHGGYMRLVSEDDRTRVMELHREDGSCLLIDERPLAEGGFVTFVTDVTERKRTDLLLNSIREEQRLLARRYHEEKIRAEAASRSKTSFLAHLSHDIRTPLNHIIGFADLIRHQTYGPLGDERYLDYVDTIKGSGERLLASFATILDLAELEGGQKTLREEEVQIDDLIVSTTRRFSAQAARAGLTLSVGAECDATLKVDRFCLERMLGNIIENSIRFTPSGGKITLAAFAATDGVVVEISDTGIGMTDEQLATLSQPFVLGDAAFTREHGGTGLGIAIARAIAELSGGRLAIDSSPAMGTTVAISLPLRPVQVQRKPKTRAA